MNYGEKLKTIRADKNLTQNDIAEILNISRSAYKDYETQIKIIPIKHLVTLSNYYDISIDYILGISNINKYSEKKEIDKIEAGNRLKELRKENQLTQKKLAEILNTTFSNIAFYEKGRNLIATPFLYMICKKYKISADYLLGRIDYPKYII